VFEAYGPTPAGDLHMRRFRSDATSDSFEELAPFHAIWHSKCGDGRLPRWSDFGFNEFLGWHRYLALSDIQPEPLDLRFRIFGSGVVELMNDDLTGKLLTQSMPASVSDRVIEHFTEIRNNRLIGFLLAQVGTPGSEHRHFKVIELPLVADDGNQVTQILHGFVTNLQSPGWP
jgi:PAS domain